MRGEHNEEVTREIAVRVLRESPGFRLPSRATPGSAGLDLRAAIPEPVKIAPGKRQLVGTGIALDIRDPVRGNEAEYQPPLQSFYRDL